ncbi:MAG TPA: MarR family transcriptional regulator [Thermoanaerobaculia bacterium]|nr:MarR family transcriptional regulator [Thermoanaerobaculia bacterium]
MTVLQGGFQMPGRLKSEIKQKRPFASLQEEVVLGMMRTADQLAVPMNEILRRTDLSLSQYNVLRILRGSAGEGLSCGDISERMVRRDPDLTRLLDRLEKRGLVTRSRSTTDRRVVLAEIAPEGLRLLESLDDEVEATVKKTLGHMPADRLTMLCELLDEAREGGGR